ncbi:MAG: hypothetical protein K5790_08980 [Nitrosopumilus sp.]|uniref:hypothetical protein n=1 Tax=Nitrosopumilus sp. TaxID=2024843 RepID=UPI00247BABBC|nr:hypothetical protein [Nitrosopumilus sp.]MCV0393402.1 hypothetical protein [Nitrosopumilus sp.]
MRFSILVLIIVLVIGSIVISIGLLTNQEFSEVSNIPNQYENLQKYKNELEKINQYNQKILDDLERQFNNTDDVHLEQLKKEITVVRQVINENKAELEDIIKKLSNMTNSP